MDTPKNDPFVEFKAAQREGWKSFAPLEVITIPAAATLVKFAGIQKGDAVLDVGCGTGVGAITAACKGAKATGLDLTPALLERAKYNAVQTGVSVDWHEGDVEALPFHDESFDVVISQFGHMFAPRPAMAVAEMLRVLKKGGRLAFSSWPPELFTAKMFTLVGKYLPPPPEAGAPPQWGDPHIIRERLGEAVRDITFDRSKLLTPGFSPRQIALRYEETSTPVIKVAQKLKDDPLKMEEFRKELEQLVSVYFEDNRMRQEYLLTRAIKN